MIDDTSAGRDVPDRHEAAALPGQLRLEGFDPDDSGRGAGSEDDEASLVGPGGARAMRWSSPFAASGWGTVGVVAVVLVGLGLVARLAGLGDRPFHHDESLDAWFSWQYLEGTYDGYDPVYHGPLRFYLTAWIFELLGESEATARLTAALAGAAAVGLPWLWRRDLGDVGTVAAVALAAASPSLLYFSRFGREDALFMLLTYVTVIVFVAFVASPRRWHPTALLGLIVAAMAVKESVFLVIFVFGAFGMVLLAQEFALARRPGAPRFHVGRGEWCDEPDRRYSDDAVRRVMLGFGLVAMIVAFGFGEPIFVSLGVYGLVLAAMLVLAAVAARRRGVRFAGVPVLSSIVSVPVRWWAGAVAFAGVLFVALFTQFFTRFDGPNSAEAPYGAIENGLRAGFEYWRGEQDTIRGDSRWQYYLAVIPAYEWLVVILAFVGMAVVFRRPTLVGQTMLWWAVATFTVHSWAGERMPWLIVHPLLPLVLLAGLGVQALWEHRRARLAAPIAIVLVAGFGFSVFTVYEAAYVRGGEPEELFVQAGQASGEVPEWVDRLELLDRLIFAQEARHLEVSIDSEIYWPYGWYLRDFPSGTYAVIEDETPTSDVVFLPHWKRDSIGSKLVGYTELPYEHRWWWVPDFDVGPASWLRWVWDRTTWDGSMDDPSDAPGILSGYVYVADGVFALEQRYEAPLVE